MTTRTAKDSKQRQKTATLVRLTTRVPEDIRQEVDNYLRITGKKLQYVVAAALKDYVNRIGNPAR